MDIYSPFCSFSVRNPQTILDSQQNLRMFILWLPKITVIFSMFAYTICTQSMIPLSPSFQPGNIRAESLFHPIFERDDCGQQSCGKIPTPQRHLNTGSICCPEDAVCCSELNICCPSGATCCSFGCCPTGSNCCNGGCCAQGGACCGNGDGCCGAGLRLLRDGLLSL